jgi:predicted dehydrogenase
MSPVKFGIVGGGRRACNYVRLAKVLPERFELSSMLIRNPAKMDAAAQKFDVPVCGDLDGLLSSRPKFVVVSVPRSTAPELIKELRRRDMPVLSETPPALDLEGLVALYRETDSGRMVQVSEQFHLMPIHNARIAVVRSGMLGTPTEAQVSCAHAYHGISLLRKLLDVSFERVTITAHRFSAPIVDPQEECVFKEEQENQTLAWLDYGSKLGVYDFTRSQYFTRLRSARILVRGNLGEISGTTIRYLNNELKPEIAELIRHDSGDDPRLTDSWGNRVTSETTQFAWGWMEQQSHKGIMLGKEWIYANPFFPVHMSDDEVGIAHCLQRMVEYVEGGPSFYSLAEAAQDHYLGMMIDKAVETGKPVVAEPQVWSS